MLLSRLRIRGKLALLVLIPLLATISLTIANAVELVGNASRARQTADAVQVARLTGELVRELQQERLLSVGLLRHEVSQSQLSLQNASVTEKAASLRKLGAGLPPAVAAAVDKLKDLDVLRKSALTGSADVAGIFAGYAASITGLIDSTGLLDAVDGNTPQGRQVIALDAIMRANEGFASLLAAMAIVPTPAALIQFAPGAAVILPAAVRFTTYATPDQVALYQTSIAAVDARLGQNFAIGLLTNPGDVVQLKALPTFAAIDSLTSVGRFVETKIINDVLAAATSSANQANTQAVGFGSLSLVTILLVVLLGVAVGQSVAGPLRRLTQSADRVARLAESELVRVADDDSSSPEPARLQPVDIAGRDELGDLARAFGRVQETAARLVQRQVAGRRNVAQMFGHVGRRTQNLVGRQVAIIDKLENDETEPGRLRDLYRLDHVSSRLRRSASSLVVLSGATVADEHIAPVRLGDVIRLALAEIEDYSRVDVEVSTSVRVIPALISDLVLLLAELMENATTFSPPGTPVTLTAVSWNNPPLDSGLSRPATSLDSGLARLTIVDHGLGMSAERLAEENARLTRRERLDLAPTEVLGLFVVGRLARRHGLAVSLLPTDGGGVTVIVDVPAHLLTAFGPVATPAVAGASVGASAGWAAGRIGKTAQPSAITARVVPTSHRRPASLMPADPAMFNVGALDRATRTLDSVQPWNAFQAGGPGPAEIESAPAPSPVPAPPPAPALPPPARPPLTAPAPAPAPAAWPATGLPPAPLRLPEPVAGTAPSRPSTLNRRVPGATLSSLEAQVRPRRSTVGHAPSGHGGSGGPRPPADAEQARDSMADFESGIARAMREVGNHREPGPGQAQTGRVYESSHRQESSRHESGREDDTLEGPSFSPPAAVGAGYVELFPGGRGYHEPDGRGYEARVLDDRRTDEEGS